MTSGPWQTDAARRRVVDLAIRLLRERLPPRHSTGLISFLENNAPVAQSPFQLWKPLLEWLVYYGSFDLGLEILAALIKVEPTDIFLQLLCADLDHRTGRNERALRRLMKISGSPPVQLEVARLRSLIDPKPAVLDYYLDLLVATGPWSQRYHGEFFNRLLGRGDKARSEKLYKLWTSRFEIGAESLEGVGEAALQLKEYGVAKQIFAYLHPWLNQNADQLVGRFDQPIPPYTADIERDLVARIEQAFFEEPLVPDHYKTPQSAPLDLKTRVLFVSFDAGGMENDLAAHFAQSAALAGIELTVHLDSALCWPFSFPATDQMISHQIALFTEKLDHMRPDVVIFDCLGAPQRSLTPDMLTRLRDRFGFRLICMMRDSHIGAQNTVKTWLPICDSLVVFDPHSIGLIAHLPHAQAKVIALPVPAMNGPYLARPGRTRGVVFVGALGFKPRLPVLAELAGLPIDFEAIVGARRNELVPNMAAYAGLLTQARAVLNFARHGTDVFLVTGRVWESIAAGALLIEQENPITAELFKPYRHYLPWRNVTDIAHIAQFIVARPDLAQRIADEAHAFAGKHYNAQSFWCRLLAHALRPLDPAEIQTRRASLDNWPMVVDGSVDGRLDFLASLV
jgi:hypothetical protein